jgi:hypothetical protein
MALQTERTSQREQPGGEQTEQRTEQRAVRAADPRFSTSTNAQLTEELRAVIGATEVEVPVERPHASEGEQAARRDRSAMTVNRLTLAMGVAIAITIGTILVLTTGSWWFLPLAAGVHAVGTFAVTMISVRLTTTSEHPSPHVAAAMSAEGVVSPDEYFTRMVDEFRPQPNAGAALASPDSGHRLHEAVAPHFNERTVASHQEPALAGAEQASAMTPTAQPSATAPAGHLPDLVTGTLAAVLALFSLAVAIFDGGGWMWLTPAVMLPLLTSWVAIDRLLLRSPEAAHPRSWRPLAAIVAGAVACIAIFCAVVALAV